MNATSRKNQSNHQGGLARSDNYWQRVMVATHGIVTPANIVTLIGLVLALFGIFKLYDGKLLSGLVLLIVGRAADILDGFTAKHTGTKTKVGEVLDAGADKVVAGIALLVFFTSGIIPVLPLLLILVSSVANVLFSAIAKARGRELHSSVVGKHATVILWLTLVLFIGEQLATTHSVFAANIVGFIGYLSLGAFSVLAWEAAAGYARRALQKTNV